MATHSSREGESPLPHHWKTTGGGVRPRYLISLPRRLRTSAPYILFMSCFIQLLCKRFSLLQRQRQRVANEPLLDENVVVGGEIGGKRTYNFRAGNKLSALADVRGRRSTTQLPHPHTRAPPQLAARGARTITSLNKRSTFSLKAAIWTEFPLTCSPQLHVKGRSTP